jgi:predicted nuclease with TOPRIM domain
MTDSDLLQLKSWIDIAIKAIIGVVISIAGMDYRSMKNSLQELQQSKYNLTMQVEITSAEVKAVKDRLERIEAKLDRVLQK